MINYSIRYEEVRNSAAESAGAYLDMEGGSFVLALIGELIESLTDAGNLEGANLVIQRVCEAVNVECRWAKQEVQGDEAAEVWPSLFAEVLTEQLEEVGEE